MTYDVIYQKIVSQHVTSSNNRNGAEESELYSFARVVIDSINVTKIDEKI